MGLSIGYAFWVGRKVDSRIDDVTHHLADLETNIQELKKDITKLQTSSKELMRQVRVIEAFNVAVAGSIMQALQNYAAKQKNEAIE